MSTTPSPTRIAVLVLGHANPATFQRLAGALRHPAIEVLAHIDARSDLAPFQGDASAHVHFLPDRIANHWGSWTQVEATLRLLRAAREHGPFASYALVSADSLPLVQPEALVAALAARPTVVSANQVHPGSNHHRRVTGIYLPHTGFGRIRDRPHWMDRGLDPDDFDDIRAAMATREAKASIGFRVYKGLQWMAISEFHLSQLFDLMARDPMFVDIFRFSLIPDESFFNTALHLLDDGLRSTAGFMDFDWPSGPSPAVLTEMSQAPLVAAARSLFFRKFGDAGGALAGEVLARRPGLEAARAAGWLLLNPPVRKPRPAA